MKQHSRMMAEHFGISILESDAKLLHERIQLLITESYNRGIQNERKECAKLCLLFNDSAGYTDGYAFAEAIIARGEA